MERRDSLYSGQERCLGAKREWRSMNNGGQAALRVRTWMEAGCARRGWNSGRTGLWKKGFSFIAFPVIITVLRILALLRQLRNSAVLPAIFPMCRKPVAWLSRTLQSLRTTPWTVVCSLRLPRQAVRCRSILLDTTPRDSSAGFSCTSRALRRDICNHYFSTTQ